jgi:NAD+ synthase (glutamine-hydrolysing)
MGKIRIAIAQINPVVGDLSGNTAKIVSYIKKARDLGSDLVVFPELAVTGYPPEDLLMKPQFIRDNLLSLQTIQTVSQGITAIVGYVDGDAGSLFNAVAIMSNGRYVDTYHKIELPNYGVFDEFRYFKPGRRYPLYRFGKMHIGINICEDIWEDRGPAVVQARIGAELIININASPYNIGKALFRKELISGRARESGVMVVYVNMVGGQDELVFDGGSFVVDRYGRMIAEGSRFKEELIPVDLEMSALKVRKKIQAGRIIRKGYTTETLEIPVEKRKRKIAKKGLTKRKRPKGVLSETEEVYSALLLGTKDYVRKNGFKGVIIGLSGGIDSALVASIAVDSLGAKNVHGLFMSSPYTSKESREDIAELSKNLGIKVVSVPINSIFQTYQKSLSKHFRGKDTDSTEENLQARIRGNILMAFSNKFGWLVLTTGNKSEMSVGYATLYGDMAGGFAVIKDVPKTMVYEICTWRNTQGRKPVIPERILWKEPSAELRPDQRDTDSLPPYPVLDPVLKAYVEDDRTIEEIMRLGCDVECAQKVIRMVDTSEYKRRQAPPGIKITPRAFGKDRRFPITNRYKSY